MFKKKTFFVMAICLLFAMLVFMTSCSLGGSGGNGNADHPQYTIRFFVDGAQWQSLQTEGKQTLSLPQPEKDGYVFEGWFYEEDADPKVASPLTADTFASSYLLSDITVYAVFSPQYRITLSKTELSIASGDEETLTATVFPNDQSAVSWSSSDESVAEVDSQGKITAKSVGSAVVTVSVGETVARCNVTVTSFDVYVYVNGTPAQKITPIYGESSSVKITVDPLDYLPENDAPGHYFSGWFLDEGLTNSYSSIRALKNGDNIYGAWVEYQESDFSYRAVEGGVEITRCFRTDPYSALPGQLGGQPVVSLSSDSLGINMVYLIIPSSVKAIHYNYNRLIRIQHFGVYEGNTAFSAQDGVLYNADKTTIIRCPRSRYENYVMPDTVRTVASTAFSGCKSLTSVTLSSNLEYIESGAFYACDKLESLDLPQTVTVIQSGAFEECVALKGIVIPQNITVITDKTFYNCSALASVSLPEGLTTIGKQAFFRCSSLASLDLPASLTSIGDSAFGRCASLESITIGEGNLFFTFHSGILGSADGKRMIVYPAKRAGDILVVPDGAETIDDYCFSYSQYLTSITLPDSLVTAGQGMFASCSVLEELTLPFLGNKKSNQTAYYLLGYYFGSEEFEGGYLAEQNFTHNNSDAKLTCYFPSTLKKVALTGYGAVFNGAFNNCASLETVVLNDRIQLIGYRAFDGCTSLTSINLPTAVRCSDIIKVFVEDAQIEVDYCDCNSFGLLIDPNNTMGLAKWSDNRMVDAKAESFDVLSQDYASFMENYTVTDSFTEWNPTDGSDEYNAYSAFFDTAKSVFESSDSPIVRDIAYDLNTGAVIGITKPFIVSIDPAAHTYDDYLTVIARLFGYADANLLVESAQTMAYEYVENGYRIYPLSTNSTEGRLVYEGTIYTENGSFILPFAFKNELADTVLAYVIVDPAEVVSIWISDVNAAFAATNFSGILPAGAVAHISIYGRCVLFEAPRVNIYEYAFANCTSLTSIYLPKDYLIIYNGAFSGSNNLTIYCEATEKPGPWRDNWNSTLVEFCVDYLPVYWYSENEPTEEGNFWHYVNGEMTIWEIE